MSIEIKNETGEVIAMFKVKDPDKAFQADYWKTQFENFGYNLDLKTIAEKPCATAFKINSHGRFGKPLFNYVFKTEERRTQYLEKSLEALKRNQTAKVDRKEAKKTARQNMVNPFKVGDLLYDSWGYEQTNIDFYQVVEVKEKSVVIRRIAAKTVEGSEGFMSSSVTPVKDHFVGEPMTKTLQIWVSYEGKAGEVYINSKHGSISKYDAGEKGVYSSWYA